MEGFEQIIALDQRATVALNSLHCSASDAIALAFSGKAIWIPLYLFIFYLLCRRLGWKRALISIAAIGLTVLACDQGANLVKDAVARLRPCFTPWCLENGLNVLEQGNSSNPYGFFSAHAANAFGVAISSALLLRTERRRTDTLYTVLILLWAALVGLSRVLVGKHFLGDVLVGAVVGLAFGAAFALLARWLFSRLPFKKDN